MNSECSCLVLREATSLGRRDHIWGNVDSLGTFNVSVTEVRENQGRIFDFPGEDGIGPWILTDDLQRKRPKDERIIYSTN